MNYETTLAYLYSQLPMYSRIGKAAYKTDLTNTLQLCELLGQPQLSFKTIHVAGTNGKGSTSHMLAAMLQENGYRTGLYTSPHLKDFRERIRVNGEMISKDEVIDFVDSYRETVSTIGCSFFEWTVGLAFNYFRKQHVDVAVIETGLGGRLDSTNVILPELSIITNVSFDHMDLLGDTLQKIAVEKAGIIKKNVPVVIGEKRIPTYSIFIEKAKEANAPLSFASENWRLISSVDDHQIRIMEIMEDYSKVLKLALDLPGQYQERNILTVLESRKQLIRLGFVLEESKCIHALRNVRPLTGLRGRWETLSEKPVIIADVAHNEAGISLALSQLFTYSFRKMHFVLGFVQEKELMKILNLFPKSATYYFCTPAIPRGLDAGKLQASAAATGLQGMIFPSVTVALESAKEAASLDDIIYVGGSTFVVAEIL